MDTRLSDVRIDAMNKVDAFAKKVSTLFATMGYTWSNRPGPAYVPTHADIADTLIALICEGCRTAEKNNGCAVVSTGRLQVRYWVGSTGRQYCTLEFVPAHCEVYSY